VGILCSSPLYEQFLGSLIFPLHLLMLKLFLFLIKRKATETDREITISITKWRPGQKRRFICYVFIERNSL
jgi:hypothetical protein